MDPRTGFFALLLLVLAGIATLIVAPLLQYILAAGLLAFILYPAHRRLEPTFGARPTAFGLTVVAVLGVVVPLLLVSVIVLQTAFTMVGSIDAGQLLETVRGIAREDIGLEESQVASLEATVVSEAESSLSGALDIAIEEAVGLVGTSIETGLGLLVFVFLLYYMLADGDHLVDWLRDVVPLENHVRDELFEEVSVVTWAVIKSHVFVAIIEGVMGGLGFYVLGVPNVVFWTIVMIGVAFLPVIGVWLVWGPAVVWLVMIDNVLGGVALAVYGLTVLSAIDNYLRAYFVDRGSGLHPAVVIVGVIGGIYVLGIMGLFLGPVVLAVFKAGVNVFSEHNLTFEARESVSLRSESIDDGELRAEPTE
ncbi:AI-2E family transporter [Halopiger goleimassiliensis]|uniref:AI-2E family transporter n=1 Tax=Halopiger goleimassiliensis TaxID=1293048 RepID=UPI000677C25F|nr:AI-2E family transporter [Halopiger goleimassiliensis]